MFTYNFIVNMPKCFLCYGLVLSFKHISYQQPSHPLYLKLKKNICFLFLVNAWLYSYGILTMWVTILSLPIRTYPKLSIKKYFIIKHYLWSTPNMKDTTNLILMYLNFFVCLLIRQIVLFNGSLNSWKSWKLRLKGSRNLFDNI